MKESDDIIYVSESNTSIIEIYRLLKTDSRLLIKFLIFFLAIGLFIALGSPTKFNSSCTVMPLINNNSNMASSLLSQFGVGDLNFGQSMNQDDINPELYPRILNSSYFLLDLLEKDIFFSKYDKHVKLIDYYTEYKVLSLTEGVYRYTFGLYATIKKYIAGKKGRSNNRETIDNLISITYREKEYLELLAKSIRATYEKKTGLISISVEFNDPIASAEILDYTLEYLTSYITNYKTEKARYNLDFIEERLIEAEKRFLNAQNFLATFKDQNLYISSAKFQAEEERLKSEFNIAFNLYNTLSQQQIQASIKVQESTPVFTIIDPIKIPIEKSKPKRIILMIVFSILGITAGIVYVIVKQYFKKLKN